MSTRTLRDVLALMTSPPHYTGPNIAKMLGVELTAVHAALKPLEDRGLVEVTDRGKDGETWHFVKARSADEMLERARAAKITIHLDAPV
jgi:DNA-binding MarR family transcriptional regulator